MRKQKQGKKGEVAKYISRSKAIRKLQLSLKDFRKMCILKGVYPRQPPKKLKKHNRTYYQSKDINFLALDPLITRLRAQKVHMKKFKRAKARGDLGKVRHLAKNKPQMSLTHLVRQRYPDFLDALRDLDDPLSLISLFAIFPAHKQFGLSTKNIEICSQLLKHFQLYAIKSHCLKKAFVSIKGIYYQLEIMGVKVTYTIPYKYPPNLPIDVDYRVMCTFLDFYIVLLKFVLFKLYSTQNLEYPPSVNETNDIPKYSDFQLKRIQVRQQGDDKYKIDQQFANVPQQQENLLFSHLKFYLSSQVPKYSLEFVILAAGGWISEDPDDSSITHYITDRENIPQKKTRQYVQPQWIYDSLNFNKLLDVKEYWVGKQLPPHLSPFVDENDSERYVPDRQIQLRQNINDSSVSNHQTKNKKNLHQQQPSEKVDEFDVLQQKKRQKSMKKQEQKDFTQISKGLMTNKNRKLLRGIQSAKEKRNQVKQKLVTKAEKLKK